MTRLTPLLVEVYDKSSTESLAQCASSLLVISTTFSGIVLARIATHNISNNCIRYLIEFVLIVVPGVLIVTNLGSDYGAHYMAIMVLLFAIFICHTRSLGLARRRQTFDMGARPTTLTVVRALTHIITAICILAIDFNSFHRPFRKSPGFGAHLMDSGIGLFVVTMGLVSRRPRNCADVRRSLLWSVLPLLMLGTGRTVIIMAIEYGQDAHEYGEHLNAFFTLGFTKLLGTMLSAMVCSDFQYLLVAFGLLFAHQLGLSHGISDYIMNEDNPRSSVFSANREGLLSLPGFVVLYLISMYFSRWLMSKTILSYAEMIKRLRTMLFIMLLCWGLFVISAYLFGVSRVSCNFGYVVWIFGIISTMLWLTMFIFDFIINTVLPLPTSTISDTLDEGIPLTHSTPQNHSKTIHSGFLICDALNMNGLTFFMIANVLTGCVNMFLSPENRSNSASVGILLVYMLLATGVAYILFKKRIRIA
ncbi:GPI-anchored wall transfer protein 1 [Scaptodrosophila lebanonensis]|uniref:Phosphatidylinositol-glycan biosynthesis class W protein n=1 Tax=Drosophila lebanonensis TaxID=7225 RepID=A0A6J2TM06_DROLE|nr:GPI-anchored wall transfer protein 1 [Scaptodrosophila lebanonensis]